MKSLDAPWLVPVWRRFVALRAGERLPHALLLAGPPGIGKLELANLMVHSLLCESRSADGEPCGTCRGCVQHLAGTHPDCSVLTPDPDSRQVFRSYPAQPSQGERAKRRKARQRQVEIGQIRDLAERLSATAHYGGYRIAVLAPADRLRYEAANALLKLLEEPGSGVIFVLVTQAPGRVAATIRSRCQWLRCAAPDPTVAREWLQRVSPERERDYDQALALTLGAPLAARDLLAEGESAFLPQLLALLAQADTLRPLVDAGQFERLDSETLLRDLITLMAVVTRLAVVPRSPGTDALGRLRDRLERVDLRAVLGLSDWITGLRRHDAVAFNARLLLEQFLVKWQHLTARAG